MHRRTYLGLAGGAIAGLAGCTASALSGPDGAERETPTTSCPALLDADRTVCPDDTTGPLSVDRSSETVSGDDWSLRTTVTNVADEPYGFNPYAWSVYRQEGDGWSYVAPDAHIEPWDELPPTDQYSWQLSAVRDGPEGADQTVFLDLEPDTYAFAVPFEGPTRVAAVSEFALTA